MEVVAVPRWEAERAAWTGDSRPCGEEREKAVASRERGHSLRCGALERSQRFWGCWEMVVPVTEGLRQEGEPA